MRLAISLLALRPGRVGGAETYVRKLLAELPRVAEPGDVLIAVLDRELAGQLETPGWERVIVGRRGRRIVVDRLLEALPPWRARGVEAAFRLARADVVLFPQQSIFPRHVAGRLVVTVGDVQHLFHPGKIPLAERFFRWAVYGRSMERAQELIAISEFTRVTLVERCGIAPEKITTIPHGFEPAGTDGVRPTDRVVGPYLYYPAATFPHKNHAELIRSYATLRRAGSLDAKLVFTGMKTLAWRALERLARELGVADDVVHLGFLPYAEVRRVFAGAEAVVFPSRYEGFGIPVVEAAVEFRKKVITSRLPVFDEIGVPRDRQIDFAEPSALLAALGLRGPTVLQRAPSTWREVAARTMALLRATCGDVAAAGGGRP